MMILMLMILLMMTAWRPPCDNDDDVDDDGRLPGSHLVAHLGHHRPLRTDEPDAGLDTGVGEVRSLG